MAAMASASVGPHAASLDAAVEFLTHHEYDRAKHELRQLLTANPLDFDATYLLLATEQTRILDYESYTIEGDAFMCCLDSVQRTLQQRLPALRGADSTRCLFYIGNVYGGRSLMMAKNDRWLPAIKQSMTSVSYLKQVVKRDSTFSAAYLGIGVYNYYLDKNLKWVPLLGSRHAQGVGEIWRATAAPTPYGLGAKNSLCWILIEQGRLIEADSIASSVVAAMPNNTVFLRIKGLLAVYLQRWGDAERIGWRLVDLSVKRSPTNWSDLTLGYQLAVQAADKLGRQQDARAAARRAFALQIPASARKIPYVEKHLHAIEETVAKYAVEPDKP